MRRAWAVPLLAALPAWAGDLPPAGTVFKDCPTCPEMVSIPAPDGGPPAFAMGRTEVTFDQYQACVAAKACRGGQDDHKWGKGKRPVINITWKDASDYARWLTAATGKPYALPSQAQWDHAARAGTATRFWWGDQAGQGHANCRDCDTRWGGHSTAPVASYPPNPFGLFDTAGNVWEWTADCAQTSGENCSTRFAMGGAWYYFPHQSANGSRVRLSPDDQSYTLGMRILRHNFASLDQ
jgi:formylglycine-generating enzyme required for sulfatase activity